MQIHRFQDFDAYAGAVGDANHRMLLLNSTHHNWTIKVVDVSGISLQVGQEGSGNIAEGQAREDGYLFFMPLDDFRGYAANGIELRRGFLAILEPNCEFCVRCSNEHDWCSVFVPSDMLPGGEPTEVATGRGQGECRVIQPDPNTVNQIADWIRSVQSTAADCSQFESSAASIPAAKAFLSAVAPVVSRGRDPSSRPLGRPSVCARQLVHSALELIEERGCEMTRVSDLTATTGVSERTLRSAFNRYYGIGPHRYLELRRICQVHRALRSADPETQFVTELLVDNGVWQHGRFASRYRHVYGELPSETLRR